ncbi:helix-turn-helix domain-containing protein, partial [Cribrihabitans sp. XS_ASV171]
SSADRRLILRLLMFEERINPADGWLEIGQEDLAAMVAVSVPTLQRKLRSLSEAGLIEQGYGRVRILDRARLLDSCQS